MSMLKLSLALLLLLSCSTQDTALAFVQRMVPHPCTTTSTAQGSRGDDISSYKQLAMPSLRVRGGGRGGAAAAASSSATKLSTTTVNYDDADEKYAKIANQALQSIEYCCKMCLASVLADVIITFIDGNIWSRFFGPGTSLSWVDYVDIFNSLSLLVFAGGLWRTSHLYLISFSDLSRKMDRDHLLTLFQTMAWIWGIVALNQALVSVSMAAALSTHGSNGLFQFALSKISSSQLSLAAVGILGIGSIVIRGRCEKTAKVEVQAYKERHGIQQQQLQSTMPKFDMIREAGYRAYCNQALCSGSFAVMACMELVKWIVSFDGGIIGPIFSVSEFLTPIAMTLLLITFNKALIRAAIAEVMGGTTRDYDIDDEIYHDLFVAQAGFYNKVSETLKGTTIFHLLPYIVAPAIPYILKALEWISPSLFAKAIEAFDVKL